MNLLEVNDAELCLYRGDTAVYRQPAIAHVGPERTVFGLDALRIARRHPQQANAQYLARLNADPLPVPGRLAANHADLVYLQLVELKAFLDNGATQRAAPADAGSGARDAAQPRRRGTRFPWSVGSGGSRKPANTSTPAAPVAAAPAGARGSAASHDQSLVAAVPGLLSTDQLGVLLGIAQEAGIGIRGFVDSAVLMASTAPLPTRSWLLELHLTRACLTELRAGAEVAQAGAQELPGCGLMSCLDGWANLLADRFVQDTRFDPLHAADTEQQLYDQLYAWTQRSHSGTDAEQDFAAEIRHGGHERRVQLPGAVLRRKLMQRFQQLAQKLPEGARLLVAPRSAALPGLLTGLAELGIDAEGLAPQALLDGFARHAATVADGHLTLVSRLPCREPAREPAPDERPRATHVLFENRAWPLWSNPFGLPNSGRAGDTVGRDGKSLRLITVESDSGTRAGKQLPDV